MIVAGMENCFILFFSRDNRYSANILLAGVEQRVKDYSFYLIQWDSSESPTRDAINIGRRCRRVVVGFTFMTPQILTVKNLVELLRKHLSSAIFVAGGPHATGDPLGTLTKLGFDLAVVGEGEETLAELLTAISSDGEFRVCGTASIEGEKLVVRKRAKCVNLNMYAPFPYWRGRFNPIEIMRGCASACHFCQITYTFGIPRYRDVDNIVQYSKLMVSRGLKDIRFIAPNSLGYGSPDGVKPTVEAVSLLLEKLSHSVEKDGGRIFFGTFPSEARPDSVSDEVVKIMKRYVSNNRVAIGVQSGSNRILKEIHRNHSVEDAIAAIEILNRYGFAVDVDLILGFPFEDSSDFEDTLNFIQKVRKFNVRFHLHTFIPLPGTPYSNSTPRFPDDSMKKKLAKLIGLGRAYGEWCEQERVAKHIVELRSRGFIYGLRDIGRNSRIYTC